MFLRAADMVERRREEIVKLLAVETGWAGAFAGFQVITAIRLLRQASKWGYCRSARSSAPDAAREGTGHFLV